MGRWNCTATFERGEMIDNIKIKRHNLGIVAIHKTKQLESEIVAIEKYDEGCK